MVDRWGRRLRVRVHGPLPVDRAALQAGLGDRFRLVFRGAGDVHVLSDRGEVGEVGEVAEVAWLLAQLATDAAVVVHDRAPAAAEVVHEHALGADRVLFAPTAAGLAAHIRRLARVRALVAASPRSARRPVSAAGAARSRAA